MFKQVLAQNPPKEQQIHSLKGIASMYFQQKKFDAGQASITRRSLSSIPTIPETYYSLASSIGCKPISPTMKARAELGLKPTDNSRK